MFDGGDGAGEVRQVFVQGVEGGEEVGLGGLELGRGGAGGEGTDAEIGREELTGCGQLSEDIPARGQFSIYI